MEEQQHGSGASAENDSGAISQETASEESSKQVAFEDHQRVLDDMHKFKREMKARDSQISELRKALEEKQAQSLREKEDYKTLFEQTKEKLAAEQAEKQKMLTNIQYSEKYRAALPALQKAGLREDALNLLEMQSFDEIELEATSTGRFLANGVDHFVEVMQSKFPYAFQKKQMPNINSAGGAQKMPSEAKLTPEYLIKLEKECRLSGDMAPFKEAKRKYLELRKIG